MPVRGAQANATRSSPRRYTVALAVELHWRDSRSEHTLAKMQCRSRGRGGRPGAWPSRHAEIDIQVRISGMCGSGMVSDGPAARAFSKDPMHPIRSLILGFLLAIGLDAAAQAEQPLPPPFGLSEVHTPPEADRRIAWWREARFGMFIHFGVYAVAGRGEWVRFNEQIPQREYAKLADRFTPDPKAPEEWVRVARQTGMKYMVLTARHHDGFALFDSRANEFNSVRTAAHQDIVREFVDAARAGGMRVGLYYSPLD